MKQASCCAPRRAWHARNENGGGRARTSGRLAVRETQASKFREHSSVTDSCLRHCVTLTSHLYIAPSRPNTCCPANTSHARASRPIISSSISRLSPPVSQVSATPVSSAPVSVRSPRVSSRMADKAAEEGAHDAAAGGLGGVRALVGGVSTLVGEARPPWRGARCRWWLARASWPRWSARGRDRGRHRLGCAPASAPAGRPPGARRCGGGSRRPRRS